MNTFRFASKIFALCIFSLAFTALANAQTAQRTFVSTNGNDANTASLCSALNPCRSFTSALSVTSVNGEIIALSSGGYGAISINKAVQITAPTGVYVAITAVSGTAISINVGASDKVVLRGLTLNSLGAPIGINFANGRTLHVENCVVNGFSFAGIIVSRNIVDDIAEVFIKDTIVRNGADSGDGIFLGNTGNGSLVRASVDNCRMEKNGGNGLQASNNTRVTVRGSVAANNLYGFVSIATIAGRTSELSVEGCVSTSNRFAGIYAGGLDGISILRLSNATVTNNTTGIDVLANGQVLSRGNNTVSGNTTDVNGTVTPLPGI